MFTQKLMRHALGTLVAISMIAGTQSNLVFGQDLDIKGMSFEECQTAWADTNRQLAETKSAIETAQEDDRPVLKNKYRDLIDQANEIIKQMKSSGLKQLDKEPENGVVIKKLLGVMMNDARFGRDGEALQLGDELIQRNVNVKLFEAAADADRLSLEAREIFEELIIRHREAQKDTLPRVKFETSQGDLVIELFENEAPGAVGNFVSLVESGFYDGIVFHRVLNDFMAQCGCPDGKGTGGPGYNIYCESRSPEARRHFTGSLSMAHAGRDTGGSQFFLCFTRTSFLDEDKSALRGRPGHTVFGRVMKGHGVLQDLTRTHRSVPGRGEVPFDGVSPDKVIKATVVRKRDHEYFPIKVGEARKPDTQSDSEPPPAQPEINDKDSDEESAKEDAAKQEDAEAGSMEKVESDKSNGEMSDEKEAEKKDENKKADKSEGGSTPSQP